MARSAALDFSRDDFSRMGLWAFIRAEKYSRCSLFVLTILSEACLLTQRSRQIFEQYARPFRAHPSPLLPLQVTGVPH